jgi:hypothetical protein
MATVSFGRRNPWTDEDVPPRNTAGPVETRPYEPPQASNPWPVPSVGTQPYTPPTPSLNAAGRGVSPEQYYRDYLANFNVNLRQSSPAGWDDLIKALQTEGYNYTTDARTDGLHKGLYEGGDPNKFIKILNGMDQPIWMPGGDAPGAGGGSVPGAGAGYTDPSSQLFINELLSRIENLRKPVEDPMAPLYQLMALTRVQNLQGEPYTGADDAALTARYMNPLTQARDAELQQNKERIGQRGMLPTSGLLDELNKTTNQSYQQGVATHSNDLAVRAVDERQRRQQEQLSVLSDLLTQGRTARSEEDRRGSEIVDLAKMLPDMDTQRLNSLLGASGDNSAAQASSGLLAQNAQRMQQDLLNAQTQAQRDAIWGEFFGSLLNNWDSIF